MTGSLRIAYVVSRFPKTTETFIVNEIVELIALGHQVQVHTLHTSDDELLHPAAEPLMATLVAANRQRAEVAKGALKWLLRRPVTMASLAWSVVRDHRRVPREIPKHLWALVVAAGWADRLSDPEFDHVHAHWATYPAFVAMVVHELTGRRYSFTAHAHDIQLANPQLPVKAGRAAAVVTISEFNRHSISDKCPGLPVDRIQVIHCGVKTAALGELRTLRTRAAPAPVVLCVGALVPYKGQTVLVEAVGRLHSAGRDLRLRLVGDGEDRSEIERAIAAGALSDTVTVVGRLPSDQVALELSRAAVFVLASVPLATGQMEGIPVALMEAMAAGCPVVSTTISGIPELIEDGRTGRLVPPGDCAALADAIAEVLDDPQKAQVRAAAAVEVVESRYDLTGETSRLARLFTHLVSTGSPK